MTREDRFEGKNALVIGGASGIGLATARAFAREGARLLITGRDPKTLAEAAAGIGPETLTFQIDMKDFAQVEPLAEQVSKAVDRIDVIFGNAGMATYAPIEAITVSDWDDMMNVNLKSMFFLVRDLLPRMPAGGAIVFDASIGGTLASPSAAVYSASKSALRSVARVMAAELLQRGIRVNIVSPGPIETPMYARTFGDSAALMLEQSAAATPMGRIGTPDEVAAAVLFLASTDASYTTGQEIFVDGGTVSLGIPMTEGDTLAGAK